MYTNIIKKNDNRTLQTREIKISRYFLNTRRIVIVGQVRNM